MASIVEIMQGKGLSQLSLWALADAYENNRSGWPKKIVAEVAYALAIAIKQASDSMGEGFKDKKDEYTATAERYAKECMQLLAELPSRTLDDVAPVHTSLAGVTMLNYFYDTYVMRHLKDRGLLS